ncbi:MAG: diguanylate cyclase [Calditrichales bacterium]|nr:MAG: diguanylate cyclase [Calditrichales bacterium]
MEKTSFRVLIVEDHTEMLQVLSKFLTERGFEIEQASSGEAALQKYEKSHPDLILMDIMLPGISGIDLTQKIRLNGKSSEYIPILMLSAKSEVKDVIHGLEVGADDYIIKPFSFDELIARVNSALRYKTLNDSLRSQSHQLEEMNEQNFQLNQSLVEKNRELRKKIYDLRNIFDVSLELHSILDVERLINSTLLSLIGKFSSKSAVFLYPKKKNEQRLSILNSKGLYKADIEHLMIEKSDELFDYFHKNPSPQLISKLPKYVQRSAGARALERINMELISPISLVRTKEDALICLGSRVNEKPYLKTEIEILLTINNIVSIALSNASLYDEVTQLSYTDGMTELHNYRYFEMRLNEEIGRHTRNNQGVSLIILDVDHFKNYNDTLGHQAGDDVLRKLAQILKDTVRENDIVARYGGEEFAVILPSVGREGVIILAERLRSHIEEAVFEDEQVQPLGRVTVSVGTASLPIDAMDASDLIYKADTALYAAKHAGRNRVKQYSPELTSPE